MTTKDHSLATVALANDSTYGLAATAWTTDLGRAHRIAKRLKAGTVGLNCQMQFDHSVPFGRYKQSGWGYESGKAGLDGTPTGSILPRRKMGITP